MLSLLDKDVLLSVLCPVVICQFIEFFLEMSTCYIIVYVRVKNMSFIVHLDLQYSEEKKPFCEFSTYKVHPLDCEVS
jgi:hypothetical protein